MTERQAWKGTARRPWVRCQASHSTPDAPWSRNDALNRRSLLTHTSLLMGAALTLPFEESLLPSEALAVNKPVSKRWELVDRP